MSTPFHDANDTRPAFDRLLDPANFDDQGKFKAAPVDEGDPDTSAPPDQSATGAEKPENTAATTPPPDASTGKPAGAAASEKPTDATKQTADGTDPGKAATAKPADDAEETEEALKTRLSKPTDKGDEWRIRAYREGQTVRKKLAPIQSHLDRINSPERVSRGLDFVAVLGEPDQPIADAATKLTELAPTRAVDLRDFFYQETVNQWPNNVASDLVGEETTVAELKEALALKRSGGKPAQQTQPQAAAATGEVPKPEGMSDDDWSTFKEDYPEVHAAMAKELAAKTPAPNGKDAAATTENPEVAQLRTELEQLKNDKVQEGLKTYENEVNTEGQRLEAEVFSVVEERIAELGLEPSDGDDDATKTLKKTTSDDIRKLAVSEFEGPNGPGGWTDWSLCNEEQKENRKLEVKVAELLWKKDKSAWDYVDQLKARAELTLERVVTAQMKRYNGAMLQPTENRNAGQQNHQRPEIVDGSASSGLDGEYAKTPWLDPQFRQKGEDSFAAMTRWMRDHQTLPGR